MGLSNDFPSTQKINWPMLQFIAHLESHRHDLSHGRRRGYFHFTNRTVKVNPLLKGSVQQKLRPRKLYIILKLFSRRCVTENKILTFLNGQFTIYIKPSQRTLHSPVTFACKCKKSSANYVRGL